MSMHFDQNSPIQNHTYMDKTLADLKTAIEEWNTEDGENLLLIIRLLERYFRVLPEHILLSSFVENINGFAWFLGSIGIPYECISDYLQMVGYLLAEHESILDAMCDADAASRFKRSA